jgi:predicted nuclease of restriction endonuclease-like (RecB) superfamily
MKQILDVNYTIWLSEVKTRLRSVQGKAALAVNSLVIEFYWDLGKSIAEKENVWGSKLVEQVAKDLQAEFPEMKGLSTSNLKYCKRFYLFYQSAIGQQPVDQLNKKSDALTVQQAVAQIPWGHNILIFTKSKSVEVETEFALRDINKPMGVSEFQLTEILPENLKSSLPSIEEIENELKKLE